MANIYRVLITHSGYYAKDGLGWERGPYPTQEAAQAVATQFNKGLPNKLVQCPSCHNYEYDVIGKTCLWNGHRRP